MTKKYIIDIETLGLQPWHGKIVCIIILDTENQEKQEFFGRDEKSLLMDFWNKLDNCCWLIGFNSDEFDIPFLIKRSLIRNIPMKRILKSIDLRKIVNGFWFSYKRDIKGKLSDWARVLHMPVKTGSGGEVFGLYKKNDFRAITAHCREDVEVTYALFKRCQEFKLIKWM